MAFFKRFSRIATKLLVILIKKTSLDINVFLISLIIFSLFLQKKKCLQVAMLKNLFSKKALKYVTRYRENIPGKNV